MPIQEAIKPSSTEQQRQKLEQAFKLNINTTQIPGQEAGVSKDKVESLEKSFNNPSASRKGKEYLDKIQNNKIFDNQGQSLESGKDIAKMKANFLNQLFSVDVQNVARNGSNITDTQNLGHIEKFVKAVKNLPGTALRMGLNVAEMAGVQDKSQESKVASAEVSRMVLNARNQADRKGDPSLTKNIFKKNFSKWIEGVAFQKGQITTKFGVDKNATSKDVNFKDQTKAQEAQKVHDTLYSARLEMLKGLLGPELRDLGYARADINKEAFYNALTDLWNNNQIKLNQLLDKVGEKLVGRYEQIEKQNAETILQLSQQYSEEVDEKGRARSEEYKAGSKEFFGKIGANYALSVGIGAAALGGGPVFAAITGVLGGIRAYSVLARTINNQFNFKKVSEKAKLQSAEEMVEFFKTRSYNDTNLRSKIEKRFQKMGWSKNLAEATHIGASALGLETIYQMGTAAKFVKDGGQFSGTATSTDINKAIYNVLEQDPNKVDTKSSKSVEERTRDAVITNATDVKEIGFSYASRQINLGLISILNGSAPLGGALAQVAKHGFSLENVRTGALNGVAGMVKTTGNNITFGLFDAGSASASTVEGIRTVSDDQKFDAKAILNEARNGSKATTDSNINSRANDFSSTEANLDSEIPQSTKSAVSKQNLVSKPSSYDEPITQNRFSTKRAPEFASGRNSLETSQANTLKQDPDSAFLNDTEQTPRPLQSPKPNPTLRTAVDGFRSAKNQAIPTEIHSDHIRHHIPVTQADEFNNLEPVKPQSELKRAIPGNKPLPKAASVIPTERTRAQISDQTTTLRQSDSNLKAGDEVVVRTSTNQSSSNQEFTAQTRLNSILASLPLDGTVKDGKLVNLDRRSALSPNDILQVVQSVSFKEKSEIKVTLATPNGGTRVVRYTPETIGDIVNLSSKNRIMVVEVDSPKVATRETTPTRFAPTASIDPVPQPIRTEAVPTRQRSGLDISLNEPLVTESNQRARESVNVAARNLKQSLEQTSTTLPDSREPNSQTQGSTSQRVETTSSANVRTVSGMPTDWASIRDRVAINNDIDVQQDQNQPQKLDLTPQRPESNKSTAINLPRGFKPLFVEGQSNGITPEALTRVEVNPDSFVSLPKQADNSQFTFTDVDGKQYPLRFVRNGENSYQAVIDKTSAGQGYYIMDRNNPNAQRFFSQTARSNDKITIGQLFTGFNPDTLVTNKQTPVEDHEFLRLPQANNPYIESLANRSLISGTEVPGLLNQISQNILNEIPREELTKVPVDSGGTGLNHMEEYVIRRAKNDPEFAQKLADYNAQYHSIAQRFGQSPINPTALGDRGWNSVPKEDWMVIRSLAKFADRVGKDGVWKIEDLQRTNGVENGNLIAGYSNTASNIDHSRTIIGVKGISLFIGQDGQANHRLWANGNLDSENGLPLVLRPVLERMSEDDPRYVYLKSEFDKAMKGEGEYGLNEDTVTRIQSFMAQRIGRTPSRQEVRVATFLAGIADKTHGEVTFEEFEGYFLSKIVKSQDNKFAVQNIKDYNDQYRKSFPAEDVVSTRSKDVSVDPTFNQNKISDIIKNPLKIAGSLASLLDPNFQVGLDVTETTRLGNSFGHLRTEFNDKTNTITIHTDSDKFATPTAAETLIALKAIIGKSSDYVPLLAIGVDKESSQSSTTAPGYAMVQFAGETNPGVTLFSEVFTKTMRENFSNIYNRDDSSIEDITRDIERNLRASNISPSSREYQVALQMIRNGDAEKIFAFAQRTGMLKSGRGQLGDLLNPEDLQKINGSRFGLQRYSTVQTNLGMTLGELTRYQGKDGQATARNLLPMLTKQAGLDNNQTQNLINQLMVVRGQDVRSGRTTSEAVLQQIAQKTGLGQDARLESMSLDELHQRGLIKMATTSEGKKYYVLGTVVRNGKIEGRTIEVGSNVQVIALKTGNNIVPLMRNSATCAVNVDVQIEKPGDLLAAFDTNCMERGDCRPGELEDLLERMSKDKSTVAQNQVAGDSVDNNRRGYTGPMQMLNRAALDTQKTNLLVMREMSNAIQSGSTESFARLEQEFGIKINPEAAAEIRKAGVPLIMDDRSNFASIDQTYKKGFGVSVAPLNPMVFGLKIMNEQHIKALQQGTLRITSLTFETYPDGSFKIVNGKKVPCFLAEVTSTSEVKYDRKESVTISFQIPKKKPDLPDTPDQPEKQPDRQPEERPTQPKEEPGRPPEQQQTTTEAQPGQPEQPPTQQPQQPGQPTTPETTAPNQTPGQPTQQPGQPGQQPGQPPATEATAGPGQTPGATEPPAPAPGQAPAPQPEMPGANAGSGGTPGSVKPPEPVPAGNPPAPATPPNGDPVQVGSQTPTAPTPPVQTAPGTPGQLPGTSTQTGGGFTSQQPTPPVQTAPGTPGSLPGGTGATTGSSMPTGATPPGTPAQSFPTTSGMEGAGSISNPGSAAGSVTVEAAPVFNNPLPSTPTGAPGTPNLPTGSGFGGSTLPNSPAFNTTGTIGNSNIPVFEVPGMPGIPTGSPASSIPGIKIPTGGPAANGF